MDEIGAGVTGGAVPVKGDGCEMTEEAKARRRRLDHERYMRSREERKERQRMYYSSHRDEILAKARLRRIGIHERRKTTDEERAEMKRKRNHEYYLRHRDRILSDRREKRYEKQNKCTLC